MIRFTLIMCFIASKQQSRHLLYAGARTHLVIATYVYLKDTGMYMHTQPLGVRSFSSRQGDGNVMQMGFCGENFRWQLEEGQRGRERTERNGGYSAGLKRGESVSSAFSRRGIGQEPGSFLPKLNRKLDSH